MAAPLGEVTTPMRRGSGGSGSLCSAAKQSLEVEFALEFFKGALQGAVTGFLHAFRDQLVVAAWLVQADPCAHQHLHAFLRLEAQQLVAVAEHGATNLGAAVLEGEIQVPGRGAGRGWRVRPRARCAAGPVPAAGVLSGSAGRPCRRPDSGCRTRFPLVHLAWGASIHG